MVSFTAGFIDSIAGGGGLILLPSLLLSGIPPHMCLGTNKFISFSGTATALVNFIRKGKIVWSIVVSGIFFSLTGSIAGTKMILLFDQKILINIILILLPIAAVISFIPKKEMKTSSLELTRVNLFFHIPLICFIIGCYDGFFGPGTGTFLIFMLYLFLGLHLVQSTATAKFFNIASNLGSVVTFALAGKVFYTVALPLAFFNIMGGYFGSMLALKKGTKVINFFLRIAIGLLFATLLFKILSKK